MTVLYRIADGAAATPWLSPDIEAGQLSGAGFTVVPQLRTGSAYDFRVTLRNDGTEDAVPWTNSAATGDFRGPQAGVAGLAYPLSGAGRTIVVAPAGGTRVQLVPQGPHYGLELQTAAGATVKVLASTLDPTFVGRRVVVLFSPDGRRVVLLDYNMTSNSADVSAFQAQASGGLAAGAVLMGPGGAPSYHVFLPNLIFAAVLNQGEYGGLNFAFVPDQGDLFLTWRASVIDTAYAVLELRPRPRHANRVSIGTLLVQNVGQHLFSPAGDVLALVPTQVNGTVQLYELPGGGAMPAATNGHAGAPLTLNSLVFTLTVVNATAYGGITLTGITTAAGKSAIDPPLRSTCAAEVHLWIATPAGAGGETGPGTFQVPAGVATQGASAYVARVPAHGAATAVIAAQYVAPMMTSAADHRCAFAEGYSVAGANPFQGKQRTGVTFAPLTWAQLAQRNLIVVGPNSPYFVVPYALHHDGSAAVDVRLTLEQLSLTDLPRIRPFAKLRRPGELDVTAVGFADYPCGVFVGRDQVETRPDLDLRLEPGEQRMVAVVIDVATEPDPRRLDIAVVNVVEERSDGTRGGITVLAASAPDLIRPVLVREEPDACPVELVGDLWWADSGEDGARGSATVPSGSAGHLVGEIRNASALPIDGLEVWVESHSVPGARLEPLVFQALHLDPGETIRAAWPFSVGSRVAGRYLMSLVAQSPTHAQHRLLSQVSIGSDGEG